MVNEHTGTDMTILTRGFVVIYIDSLQLQIRVTMVGSSWVNAMLIGNDFPKLETLEGRLNCTGYACKWITVDKGLN